MRATTKGGISPERSDCMSHLQCHIQCTIRSIRIVHGVTEDRLRGETRRVGVLLADKDAGRKKGAATSVDDVSP